MPSDVSLSGTSTDLLSGSIRWTGLGSGIDFVEVVDQLVAIERTQINSLESWKITWEDKITSLQGLNSRMASVGSFCEDFDSFEEFYSRSISSSNTSVLTATNTSDAVPGSHTVVVGQEIVGRVATRSYQDGTVVGGNAGTQLMIRVGDPNDSGTWQTVTLTEGVDWDGTVDDIDALAAAIDSVDDAGSDILEAVEVVEDKTRGGNTYKRLIITARDGGTDNQLWVEQPAGMDLFYEDTTYKTSIDDPFYEGNWNNTGGVDLGKQGAYLGSTNKTFTFMINTTGVIGQEDINVSWADNEGNSGAFVVDDFGTYDVFQGVQVEFLDTTPGDDSDDIVFAADSFIMDVYQTTLQNAQDSGLAQTEQRVNKGFIDLITPVTGTDQTFTYYYEGVQTDIDVPAGAKLQDLVNLINSDPDNRGVRATIVDDGTSTSTAYHLILTARETGAEHTITGITGTLDNFDCSDADFETTQKATNAMLRVDGFPSDSSEYLQRSTNSVSDVITGVTFNLLNTGSAVVSVSNDLAAIKTQIETFVSSINFLMGYIYEETKYLPETGESGTMIGNYAYTLVRSIVSGLLYPEGLDREVDTYTQLSQIGIKTDPDQNGKWVIDSTALENALNNDLEAVARLFVEDSDRGSTGVCVRLVEKLKELTDSEDGIANVLIDNYNGIIKGIDDKIANEEKRINLYEQRLNEKFARLEKQLSALNAELSYIESQLDNLPKIGES
ncbi:MAG: flagellar filament capping protein FliD [Deltaproteobacteria bacterium]|nr:flagellar filament capping protein FliD [Deltaproteobacteria bacterium]MBW2140912.1 flagellar filament capping protein FliD [Deltaproteobacteria bacterium]MBW2322663.1 flagellar filament capping protein FliD [Deltaproteobacteria bacterium]